MTSIFKYDVGFFPMGFKLDKEELAFFKGDGDVTVGEAKEFIVGELKERFHVLQNKDIKIKIYDVDKQSVESDDSEQLNKPQYMVKAYVISKNGGEDINLKNFIYEENIFGKVRDIFKKTSDIDETDVVKEIMKMELYEEEYGPVGTRDNSIIKAFQKLKAEEPAAEEPAAEEPAAEEPAAEEPAEGLEESLTQSNKTLTPQGILTVVEKEYDDWNKGGNQKLFNIFDLFEGQKRVKDYYNNDMVGLDIHKFNKAFLKLYTIIFIKYSYKLNDETKFKKISDQIGIRIDIDNDVSKDTLLTMEKVKEIVNKYVRSAVPTLEEKELTSNEEEELFKKLSKKIDKMIEGVMDIESQNPPTSQQEEENEASPENAPTTQTEGDTKPSDSLPLLPPDPLLLLPPGTPPPPPPPGSPPRPQGGGRRLRRKKRTNKKSKSVRKKISSRKNTQKRRTQKRRTQKKNVNKRY